jgi:pyruvate dehydrogenase (quinone)
MSISSVADLIAETLEEAGVRRIYGLVGDSLNGITESLRQRQRIDWVHVRHEEILRFARAVVALATCT